MECYFFGSFNPVHIGHIKIAKEVLKRFNYEKIIFVPAFCPPHKNNCIEPIQRLNMLKLIESNKIKVSNIEFTLPVPSYSYRTIEKLLETQNERIHFIIGFDAFKNIENWKNPEFLKENLFFVVLKRKGEKRAEIEKMKDKGYHFVITDEIDMIDISSTDIREKIKNGESIKNFVDEKVERYIKENGLYKRD